MSQEDVALVKRGFELYRNADPAIAEIAHPDIEVFPLAQNLLTADSPYSGREAVALWAVELAEQGFRVELEELRDLGDNVLATGVIVAEAPGRPRAAARAAWLVNCHDGQVVRIQTFHSEEEAFKAANVEG
jgi:hypothetical protein